MRNITRLIAATFVSVPLVIGAAGLASASAEDVYYEHETSVATSEGAGSEGVLSGVEDGVAFFLEQESWAGEEGAYSSETGALAGGDTWGDEGFGWHGSYYWDNENYAGEEGAYSESTESYAGDEDEYDEYDDDAEYDEDDDEGDVEAEGEGEVNVEE
ncbi:hypothetical protein [Saccharothrix sp. Mg75]|uniref:hypothetical protein n=1 Tax=Saccharothrix sp. Mg75 TaxID=3445357 RepID=UPI003EEC7DED